MRITKGERLILMNQQAIMEALVQVPWVVPRYLHAHVDATKELLDGHHTDGQADQLLHKLKDQQ